ncbi:TonB-dependent receptor [Sphingopyxis sp. USTB-05]|uniref:TonB-dependent receptor n=1 Tax=Sphingopyxis sp. USTB-05 TaxID=2830667 RepID=UPI002078EB14|nr:TonB-dependent receptor [Sphingopyxis sp. USTB-05]USI78428.1 TonB-dependent receptor [Sphingopyxis sp. USTB-05]
MGFASIRRVAACGISILALGQASGALAQEVDDNEIVVTAAKREQSVRDVSGSVSAVSEATLQKLNAQSLSDYITRVPGVVFNDYQPGNSEVVIRGIASTTYHEANQATTGYYLNELPLGEPGFPLVIPDIDAFDISRVEVLRGPQGTLFGSSSLGGAINYVVNEADPSKFDAGFEGMVSTTKRAGEASYAVKGMVNAPLVTDKLAVRLVALQRVDAGYLNSPGIGDKGSNDLRVRGLRGSIVFTPTETTRISALSMYQEYDLDDQTYVFIIPGTRNYTRPNTEREYQDSDFQMHSLRVEQDLGFATLTAVGSYTKKKASSLFDYGLGAFDPRTGTPLVGIGFGNSNTRYAEVRLASPDGGRFRWLLGANYTRLKGYGNDRLRLEGIADYVDANPGEFGGQPSSVITPDDFTSRSTYRNHVTEKAIFGEISYDIIDQLTLTLGGRLFEYRTRAEATLAPNIDLVPAFDYAPAADKQSDFIPKASLTYKPNDDFMVYALYSEGFRIGGLNVFALPYPDLPQSFGSDTTKNYEVGTRFDLIDGTLSVDLTAYHIDWGNIQARLFTPDIRAYTVNGAGANIDGVELSLTMRPTRGLTFTSNVSYNDARLSSLLPDSFAPGGGYAKGSRLPGASEWILSNSIDLTLPDSPLKPRIGLSHRYMSSAPVAFGATLEKGDFHVIDLNASVTVSDRIELGLFAKNLFNQYGILNAPFSFAGSVARPRTIGASVRFSLN